MTPRARIMITGALMTAALHAGAGAALPMGTGGDRSTSRQFLVLHRPGDRSAAERALARTAGTAVRRIPRLGVLVLRSRAPRVRARLLGTRGVTMAVPDGAPARPPTVPARTTAAGTRTARALQLGSGLPEPLEPLQWTLPVIRAAEASGRQGGRPEVVVGIVDAGVDPTHPDLRGVFDAEGSRVFTRDQPADGPCADEADGRCVDAPDTDDLGSGTHLASVVAAPRDGFGMAGVAPGVRVASLRATQDRGVLLLTPFLDAIAHAANRRMSVVLVGGTLTIPGDDCSTRPAAAAARAAARTAVQRAVDDARRRGVTVVAGAGDGGRLLDGTGCAVLPAETRGVVAVSGLGPDRAAAQYTNRGLATVWLAAPGGDRTAFPDDPLRTGVPENMVIGADPAGVAAARGELDADGVPLTPVVVRNCDAGSCSYYRWREGTAVAAASVAGTAALVISRYGVDRKKTPLTPGEVAVRMARTAAPFECPAPTLDVPSDCHSEGDRTSVAGFGVVDAAASVGARAAVPAG